MYGPGGFIRRGRVLGGESKTIADGGVAKLTLAIIQANGMPPLTCLRFRRLNLIAFHLIPNAGAGYA